MLEAAENEEWDAENDAERGTLAVNRDREVHNDATENRANQETPGNIPARDFGAGGFDDARIANTEGEADEPAGKQVDGENREEMERFDFVLEQETAFPCK